MDSVETVLGVIGGLLDELSQERRVGVDIRAFAFQQCMLVANYKVLFRNSEAR